MVARLLDEVKSENFSDDDLDDNLLKQTRAAALISSFSGEKEFTNLSAM